MISDEAMNLKKGLIIQTYCFYQKHYDFFIIIRTTTSSVLVNYLDFFLNLTYKYFCQFKRKYIS